MLESERGLWRARAGMQSLGDRFVGEQSKNDSIGRQPCGTQHWLWHSLPLQAPALTPAEVGSVTLGSFARNSLLRRTETSFIIYIFNTSQMLFCCVLHSMEIRPFQFYHISNSISNAFLPSSSSLLLWLSIKISDAYYFVD